jgi:hypothetical protein
MRPGEHGPVSRIPQETAEEFGHGGTGVVEDEKPDRVAVAPEMLVVLLDGFTTSRRR